MTATTITLFDDDARDQPAHGPEPLVPAPAGWPAAPGPAAYRGLLGEIVRGSSPRPRPTRSRSSPSCWSRSAPPLAAARTFRSRRPAITHTSTCCWSGRVRTSRKGTRWDHARRLICERRPHARRADPDRPLKRRGSRVGGARPHRLRSRRSPTDGCWRSKPEFASPRSRPASRDISTLSPTLDQLGMVGRCSC